MTKRKLADREKRFLDILNAVPSINSGATFGDGDGTGYVNKAFGKITYEIKCTDAKSFSVKKETWVKAEKEARRINTIPVLAIDIQEKRLVVMDANDFMTMVDYIESMDK